MEDGPATRTRSATVSNEFSQSISVVNSGSDSEVFKTPNVSPKQQRRRKRKSTTSDNVKNAGVNVLTEDIRNFFPYENSAKLIEPTPRNSQLESVKGKLVNSEGICEGNEPYSVNTERDLTLRKSVNVLATVSPNNNNTKLSEYDQTVNMSSRLLLQGANAFTRNQKVMSEVQKQRDEEQVYRMKRQKEIDKLTQQQTREDKSDTENSQEEISTGNENLPSEETSKMDISLVYNMFKDLKKEISANNILQGETRVQQLENRQDQLVDSVLELKEELAECKMQNALLATTVCHLSSKLDEMESKVNKIDSNAMKKSVVVSGFNMEQNKQNCIEEVQNFLSKNANRCTNR